MDQLGQLKRGVWNGAGVTTKIAKTPNPSYFLWLIARANGTQGLGTLCMSSRVQLGRWVLIN
jgi:hypothetical protein